MADISVIQTDIADIKLRTDEMAADISLISEAISKYDALVKEIDAIAFKVNIISLNASIEAARAGEHGRTFSVVAGEIRKLASDSHNAAESTRAVSLTTTAAIKSLLSALSAITADITEAHESVLKLAEC